MALFNPLPEVREIAGTTLVIACSRSSHFGNYLQQVLPCLQLAKEAGAIWDERGLK